MTTKLLAVDDSKTMRKVLEITFAGNTYDSTVVGSADEALAAVRSNPPQVVVVDGHLGGQSGYDLCAQIKKEVPQAKVMLLSSKQRPFDAAAAGSAGVDEHFDKPFDSTKFLDKLSTLDIADVAPAAAAAPPPAAVEPPPQPPVELTPVEPEPEPEAKPEPATLGRRPPAPAQTSTPVEKPQVSQPAPAAEKPKVVPAPAARPAPAPEKSAPAAAASVAAVALPSDMTSKLQSLGLTKEQVEGVLSLSRDVVEQVVWEVVPTLAETMIKEEIARLTAEG